MKQEVPVERRRLEMCMRGHRIEHEGDFSSCKGTGSSGQVVRWACENQLATSSIVTRSKKESVECGFG